MTDKTKQALKKLQAVTSLSQVTVELVQDLKQAANELLGPEAEHPENRKPEDTAEPTKPVSELVEKAELPRRGSSTPVTDDRTKKE
jgi:hypothetical protein